MVSSTTYTIASVLLTSSVALVCLVTLGWYEEKLRGRIPLMIAVTSGVLLGEAIFHLLPEALKSGIPLRTSLGLVALGTGLSYLFELACKMFLKEGTPAPVARISLAAESVHNAIDGAIIAAAYITGIRVGLFATMAILIHELPHELGNFSILVHAGYGRKKALVLNALSACAAMVGAAAVVLAGKSLGAFAAYVLPAAAGCFIYIAAFDLLPGLWRGADHSQRARLGYGTTVGATIMLIVTLAS